MVPLSADVAGIVPCFVPTGMFSGCRGRAGGGEPARVRPTSKMIRRPSQYDKPTRGLFVLVGWYWRADGRQGSPMWLLSWAFWGWPRAGGDGSCVGSSRIDGWWNREYIKPKTNMLCRIVSFYFSCCCFIKHV